MDDAFGDEEAEDELVDQVLAELQIQTTGDMVNAPTTEVGAAQKETVPEKQAVAEGAPVVNGRCCREFIRITLTGLSA